jgi:hypothetical protein
MKKKLIWTIILFILVFALYVVVFRTKTVTYSGENKDWSIKIHSKLVGLNGSYRIEVQYKGEEPIQYVDFNIHPHYDVGIPDLNETGYYIWECKDDCGYYAKESELLFFVIWKGKDSEEKGRFIVLRKITGN